MAVVIRVIVCTIFAFANVAASADDQRAQVNYMLHCQGCHLPEAEGFAGKVPPMKDFAGYFAHSKEGREFLIRVPGVAQSALGDSEISELMNWLLQRFSAEQLPEEFAPFTAAEVNRLRQDPESSPESTRQFILENIANDLPSLATVLTN